MFFVFFIVFIVFLMFFGDGMDFAKMRGDTAAAAANLGGPLPRRGVPAAAARRSPGRTASRAPGS